MNKKPAQKAKSGKMPFMPFMPFMKKGEKAKPKPFAAGGSVARGTGCATKGKRFAGDL